MASGSIRRSSPSRNSRNKRVVAVPLPSTVERNQEQARGLEAAQLRVGGSPRSASASGADSWSSTDGAAQEPLGALGQLQQRLAVEVVGDEPIVAGDRRRLAVAVTRDQRREVEADRPSFGALGDLGSDLGSELISCVREDLLGAGRVEREVAGPNSSASPEARSRGRCGCSERLAATSCEPRGMPETTTPSASWQPATAPRGGRRA